MQTLSSDMGDSWFTWFLFFALASMWGASYLFIKIALEWLPPFTLVALRLSLGAILVWLVVVLTRVDLKGLPWRHMVFMGIVNTAAPFLLITWGEQTIPSGLASLIVGAVPIFTAILAHGALRQERLTLPQWVGVFVGFAGLGVLFLPGVLAFFQGRPPWGSLLGQGAVLGAALCYAAATVYARRHLREYPPFGLAAMQLTVAAAALWLLVGITGSSIPLRAWPPRLLLAIGWLGLASSGLAYIVYYALIRRMGATQLTLVAYVIPVLGLALGVLVLDERLGWDLLFALGLILIGIVMVHRPH